MGVQRDGKVIAPVLLPNDKVGLVRLSQDGRIDYGFGSHGAASTHDLLGGGTIGTFVLPSGEILLVVAVTDVDPPGQPFTIVYRFNAGGRLRGKAIVDEPATAAALAGGQLLLANDFFGSSDQSSAIVKVRPNGQLNRHFGTNGVAHLPIDAKAIAVQPNARIVVGGENAIVRLDTTGQLDATFGAGGIASLPVTWRSWGLVVTRNGIFGAGATEDREPGFVRLGFHGGVERVLRLPRVARIGTLAAAANGKLTFTGAPFTGPKVFLQRFSATGRPERRVVHRLPFNGQALQALPADASYAGNRLLIPVDFIRGISHFFARVVAYRPNGKVARGFGDNGVVKIPARLGIF